jgi:hypothetical protein
MIYYLGLLSHEQFTLVISLLVSVCWGNWWLVLGLAGYMFSLDLGNGVIVFAFLAVYLVIAMVWRLAGFRGVFAFLLALGALAYFGGYELLNYVQIVPLLADKATAIFEKSLTAEFLDKYPIILRPVITYITGVFMTPAGIKAVPVHLMFAISIGIGLWRLRVQFNHHRFTARPAISTLVEASSGGVYERGVQSARRQLPMIAALTTIVSFSLLMPDYANAKYYMFLAPFFARPMVDVFGRQSRFLFLNACCGLMLVWLAFQYV